MMGEIVESLRSDNFISRGSVWESSFKIFYQLMSVDH